MDAKTYYSSRWFAVLGSVVLLPMTLALVSISSLNDISGVFFGLLSLMFAWFSTIYLSSIFRRSKVTLTPEGFTVRRVLSKPAFVAWQDVKSVHTIYIRGFFPVVTWRPKRKRERSPVLSFLFDGRTFPVRSGFYANSFLKELEKFHEAYGAPHGQAFEAHLAGYLPDMPRRDLL